MNEVRVYFSLRGDFVPNELTEFLGIEPSRSAKAGEKNQEKGIPKCLLWTVVDETVKGKRGDVFELSKKA